MKIWTNKVETPLEIERTDWRMIPIRVNQMPPVQISFIEKLNWWIREGAKYYTLITVILRIIIGLKMNSDKKTTILGYVKAGLLVIVGALFLFGLVPETLLTTLGGASTWAGIGAVVYGIIEAFSGKETNKNDDTNGSK